MYLPPRKGASGLRWPLRRVEAWCLSLFSGMGIVTVGGGTEPRRRWLRHGPEFWIWIREQGEHGVGLVLAMTGYVDSGARGLEG